MCRQDFNHQQHFKLYPLEDFKGFFSCLVSKIPIVFFMVKTKSCKLLAEIHKVKKENT